MENYIYFVYFFFQAEDGIRDAQESRGLGDVYKRQVYALNRNREVNRGQFLSRRRGDANREDRVDDPVTVSYTHLTLPTIYSV